jgi:hypothetical protein
MDGKKRQQQNPLTGGANYNGQAANESVKTTRPGRLFMAGFQVFTEGKRKHNAVRARQQRQA